MVAAFARTRVAGQQARMPSNLCYLPQRRSVPGCDTIRKCRLRTGGLPGKGCRVATDDSSASPVIELRTLPGRHPQLGMVGLNEFGPKVILRLGIEPLAAAAGLRKRGITIDRVSRTGSGTQVREEREIGWDNLPQFSADDCRRLSVSLPEDRLTEDAAIGVMFLLIHELEGMEVLSVLQVGESGDYLVVSKDNGKRFGVEVSGIRRDEGKSETSSRQKKKTDQLLAHTHAGYVSVTAFQYGNDASAFSVLHFVTRPRQAAKTKSRKRRKA